MPFPLSYDGRITAPGIVSLGVTRNGIAAALGVEGADVLPREDRLEFEVPYLTPTWTWTPILGLDGGEILLSSSGRELVANYRVRLYGRFALGVIGGAFFIGFALSVAGPGLTLLRVACAIVAAVALTTVLSTFAHWGFRTLVKRQLARGPSAQGGPGSREAERLAAGESGSHSV